MKLEAQWIVGFVDGVGSFQNSDGEPQFIVIQHGKDVQVLHALKAHFGCGVVRNHTDDQMSYSVKEREHLLKLIIPFFEKHELKSKKRVDFIKFRQLLLKKE